MTKIYGTAYGILTNVFYVDVSYVDYCKYAFPWRSPRCMHVLYVYQWCATWTNTYNEDACGLAKQGIQFIAVAECILDQNLLRFGFAEVEFTVKPPNSGSRLWLYHDFSPLDFLNVSSGFSRGWTLVCDFVKRTFYEFPLRISRQLGSCTGCTMRSSAFPQHIYIFQLQIIILKKQWR
jgi:hypothetical protein